MNKLTFIDLFSGCGGLSEGFLQTGLFEGLAHVEWEMPMVATLRHRLITKWGHTEQEAMERVIRFDIQKTDELFNGKWSEETRRLYASDNADLIIDEGLDKLIGDTEVDVIIGGPPCQAYSIAGRAQDPNSMKDDYRNYLFESYAKVVEHYKPKVFVFENVPGLLSAVPGNIPVKERIFKAFKKIGYSIRVPDDLKKSVFCSADFNTPQLRNRVIIFGVRENTDLSVEAFYTALEQLKSKTTPLTVRDAIGHFPKFKPLLTPYKQGSKNISHEITDKHNYTFHECRYSNLRDQELFRLWISSNMNASSNDEKREFYTKATGNKSTHIKYRNLEWDKPSPTIVAHLHKDGLMFIHPDMKQARTITVREAAALQTFPDDFEFIASTAYAFKMIGNAVPVEFARSIAMASASVLNSVSAVKSEVKPKLVLNVLVACEESQRVCSEFRKLGHNAYSCDLLECSGGHPEWHFNCDVLSVIKQRGGTLQNNCEYFLPEGQTWDLMVAHPPCTFLAVSGAKWFYHPEDKDLPISKRRPHPKFPTRAADREEGIKFFKALASADIERIAIENPIGIMSSKFRKPDQIVQPYFFGDSATKTTCLWLKNLPPLTKTNVVSAGEKIVFKSGKSLPKWYSDGLTKTKTPEERRTWRSKTFPGFAKAIAKQWSAFVIDSILNKKNKC